MKLYLLVLTLLVSKAAIAQQIAPEPTSKPITNTLANRLPITVTRRNIVKINPLSLLADQLSIFYERVLNDSLSLVVGYGNSGIFPDFSAPVNQGDVAYQRLTIEGRYCWTGSASSGFYAGPYLRVTRLTERYNLLDAQGRALKDSTGTNFLPPLTNQIWIWIPGLMIGHQFRWKRFCLDTFLGPQFQIPSSPIKGSNQVTEAMTSSFALRVGISLGMAF